MEWQFTNKTKIDGMTNHLKQEVNTINNIIEYVNEYM